MLERSEDNRVEDNPLEYTFLNLTEARNRIAQLERANIDLKKGTSSRGKEMEQERNMTSF